MFVYKHCSVLRLWAHVKVFTFKIIRAARRVSNYGNDSRCTTERPRPARARNVSKHPVPDWRKHDARPGLSWFLISRGLSSCNLRFTYWFLMIDTISKLAPTLAIPFNAIEYLILFGKLKCNAVQVSLSRLPDLEVVWVALYIKRFHQADDWSV